MYRILNKHRRLHKHHRRPQGVPLQRAQRSRQVIQVDPMGLAAVYTYTAINTFTREAHVVIRPSLQAEDDRLCLPIIVSLVLTRKTSWLSSNPSTNMQTPSQFAEVAFALRE